MSLVWPEEDEMLAIINALTHFASLEKEADDITVTLNHKYVTFTKQEIKEVQDRVFALLHKKENTMETEQIAVGLSFSSMLEWTFIRGQSLQDRIEEEAKKKLKKEMGIDYENEYTIGLYGISTEGDDIEVVFNLEKRT